jgi:hypothetical protein
MAFIEDAFLFYPAISTFREIFLQYSETQLADRQDMAIICYSKVCKVAARSKAWVCGRSLTGIAGLNPTGGMDVCLL